MANHSGTYCDLPPLTLTDNLCCMLTEVTPIIAMMIMVDMVCFPKGQDFLYSFRCVSCVYLIVNGDGQGIPS